MATPQTPHTWTAGDDATSTRMQSLTDAILQVQGATPGTGGALDYAVLRQTSAQTLTTSSTSYPVTFDTEDIDAASGHSTSSNTSRYVAQTTGWYHVDAIVGFTAHATGRRSIRFQRTASGPTVTDHGIVQVAANNGTDTTVISASTRIFLTAGDYVEVVAVQTSGGSLALVVAQGQPRFTVKYEHP